MSSFNSINGVPATANPFTLTQILRKEWGFDGFVVSDWGSVAELINHSIGDGPTVARKALEAGVDMDMEGNLYGTVIAAAGAFRQDSESVVDEAVRRILRVKFALGLFEHPYVEAGPAYDATPERRALTPQGRRRDAGAAEERSGRRRGRAAAHDRQGEKGRPDRPHGRQPARHPRRLDRAAIPSTPSRCARPLSERLGDELCMPKAAACSRRGRSHALNKVNFGGHGWRPMRQQRSSRR